MFAMYSRSSNSNCVQYGHLIQNPFAGLDFSQSLDAELTSKMIDDQFEIYIIQHTSKLFTVFKVATISPELVHFSILAI